jgi:hypothetical protein
MSRLHTKTLMIHQCSCSFVSRSAATCDNDFVLLFSNESSGTVVVGAGSSVLLGDLSVKMHEL